MLPDEIEKSLKRLGTDGVRCAGLLEREFAGYLQTTEKARERREPPVAVTATLVTAAPPVRHRALRERLATQVFSPDAPSVPGAARPDPCPPRRTVDAEAAPRPTRSPRPTPDDPGDLTAGPAGRRLVGEVGLEPTRRSRGTGS